MADRATSQERMNNVTWYTTQTNSRSMKISWLWLYHICAFGQSKWCSQNYEIPLARRSRKTNYHSSVTEDVLLQVIIHTCHMWRTACTHLDNDHFVPSVVIVPGSHCEEDEHHNQNDCKNRGTNNDSFHVLRETWNSRMQEKGVWSSRT